MSSLGESFPERSFPVEYSKTRNVPRKGVFRGGRGEFSRGNFPGDKLNGGKVSQIHKSHVVS